MPRFKAGSPDARKKAMQKRTEEALSEAGIESAVPTPPNEPRCSVCQSDYRRFIDAMLVRPGVSYRQIAERVPGPNGSKLSHQAISNHAKKHLGFHDDAIRKILEEEAEALGQDYEQNVKGAFTYRGALEITVRKVFDDIVAGRTEVEAKDMLVIIQQLQKMDEQTSSAQVDFLRAQTSAFIQAIREEIDDQTVWERISNRARRLMELEGYEVATPTENLEETVDAEVVQELPAPNNEPT